MEATLRQPDPGRVSVTRKNRRASCGVRCASMIIGIVAVDRNGAIGKDGRLPWHYSADMKFFKETTTGHACVMGYNTWLTLKRPLPNRLNIVLSRKAELEPQDSVIVLRDIES